ncbi:MAG TPA: ATP-binding protein [Candidatus Saccharimonadales bacterium]|nr:ATP-binding protein [Candidatus Saccharimonadales bacterium]
MNIIKNGLATLAAMAAGAMLYEQRYRARFRVGGENPLSNPANHGITAKKRLGRGLKASEAHFHQLADAMPQIAFTATPDGYVDYFNQKWFEYSGFPEEQTYKPDGWAAILPPEDQVTIPRWYEIVRSGVPYEAEERYLDRRTGEYRWFLRRALPVKNGQGKIIRWFGTATDITEQKQTQIALARARDDLTAYAAKLQHAVDERTAQLHESVESMENILYHVAHDLRAPLRAMHGFTEILLEQCGPVLDDHGIGFAQRISDAVTRMDRLIQDLLTYGRTSQPDIPMDEMDLQAEVQNALALLSQQMKPAHAEVEVDAPLPAVLANQNLLSEIILNLLTNALKYVKPGQAPRIHIWAEQHEDRVRLFVQDHGIGIPSEYRERIFGMFQRLHDEKLYPGTGIGLAIVAKGVQRMSGTVGVDSTPGEGSTFWIDLPSGGHHPHTLAHAI